MTMQSLKIGICTPSNPILEYLAFGSTVETLQSLQGQVT